MFLVLALLLAACCGQWWSQPQWEARARELHASSFPSWSVLPRDAFERLQVPEYDYVGYPLVRNGEPPVLIPWYETVAEKETPNANRFVERVRQVAPSPEQPIVLICRSGVRTVSAHEALLEAGYRNVVHVRHGFEGDVGPLGHRASINGWKYEGLPWRQD